MNTEPSSITTLVSQLSGVGIIILIVLAAFIAVWLILRYLVRRWQQRSEHLARTADQKLQGFTRRIADLDAEAQAYPPDIPEPYQEPARALKALLTEGRRSYEALAETREQITSQELETPDRAPAYVLFGLWHEPRFWLRRLNDLKRLHDRIESAVTASLPAETLLRDLRAKPLQTAHKAQGLEQTLTEADDTLHQLMDAGLHGETVDEQASLIREGLIDLNMLPSYFTGGTDSQVMRKATDEEVSRAWHQLIRLETETEACAPAVERWQALHTEFGRALDAAEQAVMRATEALDQAHPTLDVRAWREAWKDVREEVDELAGLYAAPTIEDLQRIDAVDTIIEGGLDLCSRLTSLERDRQLLTQAVPRYRERLKEAATQLRELSGARRYPLSRPPLQHELDVLNQQVSEIGAVDRTRRPDQLEREVEEAQALLRASEALVEALAAHRESRERLIALIDDLNTTLEPNFVLWAEAIHERTARHTPEDWAADLNVPRIVADARGLETRRERWIPEDPTEPVPTADLARRVDEVRLLIEDGLRYQSRLVRITDRLQTINALDQSARTELDTVYQALDRLALRATDISPELDATQSAARADTMDLLEQGYQLDLAFDAPTQGRAEDRAAHVERWLTDCQEALETWMQAINRELEAVREDLASSLHALNELAPLSLEPAVQETRVRLESASGFAPVPRNAHADSPVPYLVTLSESLGERLRTRTRFYQTQAFLQSDVIEAIDQPRKAWEKAREEATRQMSRLRDLEQEVRHTWLPVHCDRQAVESQMSAAYAAEITLKEHGETVPQMIATLRETTRTYAKVIAMAEARAERHSDTRAQLERRRKDINRWQKTLERYRKANDADPTIVAAVRARIEEIDTALRQLSRPYREAGHLLAPEEAKRRVEHLWEQARRDLPVGAGDDVIPMRHVERGW